MAPSKAGTPPRFVVGKLRARRFCTHTHMRMAHWPMGLLMASCRRLAAMAAAAASQHCSLQEWACPSNYRCVCCWVCLKLPLCLLLGVHCARQPPGGDIESM